MTRRVFGGLLAPDHPLNDTTLTRWRELATHFNPGETQDNINPRVLLDEIDLLRAELNTLKRCLPGIPELCPSCLSAESTGVSVLESHVGYGALTHHAPQVLGSAARACLNCGALYFPRMKKRG